MIGTRLGPYEITAKLGEGGMGEVYRATDTKLDRQVAIKVLPAAFTNDANRLDRFEREAKLLAQLHHPHIASIFGLEEAEGVQALVMELVEGPTLAERMSGGPSHRGLSPIPLEEALTIARQIAEALEEAHEKGIIHRDLKPQNIKAPEDGKVKVLDFGLAKAMDPTGADSGMPSPTMMSSPTLTAMPGTQLGVILGTAAYMSPEQAKGKAVDKRSDIWAFGVVIYEMLTGAKLFAAETAQETLAGVLKTEIDLDALPGDTPAALRRLLRRCLERDPKRRLHDIADARLVIDDLREGRDEPSPPGSSPARTPTTLRWLGGGLLLLALALATLLGRWTAPSPGTESQSAAPDFDRFTQLTYEAGLEFSPSISPDGEFVTYAALDGDDRDLFLLRIGGQRAINLTPDSDVDENHAAFSPDGQRIAFRSERDSGGLFVMGATGESVRRLTDFGDNPAWSPDGTTIVFATEGQSDPHAREKVSELWLVAASGGEPQRIFAGDAVMPFWSPSGGRIAYWSAIDGIRNVWTLAADGTDPQAVTRESSIDWNPVWSTDGAWLYFLSDRGGVMNPWRVAIDESTGQVRGEPQPITLPTGWSGQISPSADQSRMAYRTAELLSVIRRVPFDIERARVTGPMETLFSTALPAASCDVSADGWVAFSTTLIQEDVYVMRLDGTGLRKLTDDPAKDRRPVWSPDGRQLAFYSNRSGRYEAWTVDRDGSNLRQRTETAGSSSVIFPTWSPDGRTFALGVDRLIQRFPLEEEPVPLARAETVPVDPGEATNLTPVSWSPDGRWLALVGLGANGQLLPSLTLHDMNSHETRLLRLPGAIPRSRLDFPRLAWLPNSRSGVLRWADRLLWVDAEAGSVSTVLDGLDPDGGLAAWSSDYQSIYLLESHEEGDLWLASRGGGG